MNTPILKPSGGLALGAVAVTYPVAGQKAVPIVGRLSLNLKYTTMVSLLATENRCWGKRGTDVGNEDYVYVFTKYITTRNGRRIYAFQYGLKAFRIRVKNRRR